MKFALRRSLFMAAIGIAAAACGGSETAAVVDQPTSPQPPPPPGNGTAPSPAPAPTPTPTPTPSPPPDPSPPASSATFAERCAGPGVIKCVGFDLPSDFDTGSGGQAGAYGRNSGIMPPWGTSDYSRAVRDTAVKASGESSLKFTVPSNSGADSSGSYFTNFSRDLSVQFGENSEFYVQWRQRFSPEFMQNMSGGGWKQIILGTGDQPGTWYSSCSALELVVQNNYYRGFPQMYNSCEGSASHGPYDPFNVAYGAYDFKLQNGRPAPYCLYSQKDSSYFPPIGNCLGYASNEWMTFQIRVKTGPRVGNEFVNSYVTLWVAREGRPSELVINWGPYNLTAGAASENQRYGKVWLTPYNTGKSSSVSHATAYTWYDELIISRNKIADP
jgi:hypothetical protein